MNDAHRQRLTRAASLAVAAAIATAAACVLVKLLCAASVGETSVGRDWLAAEASPSGLGAWLAQDVLFAALWGALCGAALGPWRGRGWLAVFVPVQLALAAWLVIALYVYRLFGLPPTWQLAQALEGGGAARDSIVSLLGPAPAILLLALAALCIGGALALRRWLLAGGARRIARAGAGLVAVAAVLLVGGLLAPPSALALDRNAVLELALSAATEPARDEPPIPDARLADVLAPVSYQEPPEAPLWAYQRVRQWARKRRPNVVVVVLESMATRHMHLTGGRTPNTPVLDRLAERSILWPRHYTHSPRSMTSLYSIVCSNYGVPFTRPITLRNPRVNCRSMSEVLAGRGYRAGLFHAGTFHYTDKLAFFADRGYELLLDAVTLPGSGDRYRRWSWGIEEAAAVDALLAWVGRAPERPFFATYVPVYPHHPYPLPEGEIPRFGGDEPVQRYEDAIAYVDAALGELVGGLRSLGVEDDTLILLVGDHGEAFGEHPGSKAHGSKLYEEQVRTFAMWYAPGALDGGYADPRAFGHVDLAPTLLDLLNLERQPQHIGRSALSTRPRQMIPLYTPGGVNLAGFVDGDFKFIYNRRTKATELYDLRADPDERASRSEREPERAGLYRDRVRSFERAQVDWEKSLGELAAPAQRPAAPAADLTPMTWVFQPETCEFDRAVMAAGDGGLYLARASRAEMAICRLPLPPIAGRVTGLVARGVEGLRGSVIAVQLIWVDADGNRRALVQSGINGDAKQPARELIDAPEPGEGRFGRGGTLQLELTYKATPGANVGPDNFRIDEVAVDLEHDGGAALSAVRRWLATGRKLVEIERP